HLAEVAGQVLDRDLRHSTDELVRRVGRRLAEELLVEHLRREQVVPRLRLPLVLDLPGGGAGLLLGHGRRSKDGALFKVSARRLGGTRKRYDLPVCVATYQFLPQASRMAHARSLYSISLTPCKLTPPALSARSYIASTSRTQRWIDTGIAFHSAEARPVSITHPSTRRAAWMILPAGCSQCWSLSSSEPNAPLTNTISLAGSSTVRYGTSAGKPAGMCFVEGMLSSPEQYVHLSLSQWRFGTVF